jgi:hypothetical protein
MCYVIKKGTTGRIVLLHARDASDGASPRTGLSATAPGATAAYLREGQSRVGRIALIRGQLGQYAGGSFVEVDAASMPGVYQLGIPDEVTAAGADAAVVVVRFPGAAIDPVEITLVAYDPQDESRLGMSALGPEGRIAALRGAFPLLTGRELREREALEAKP